MLGEQIKADPSIASVRLVMLTSLGDRMNRDALDDHGLAACETKPVHPDRLRATLVQALSQGRRCRAGPGRRNWPGRSASLRNSPRWSLSRRTMP